MLILAGSAYQDNKPFTQVGGFFDLIVTPSWSQINANSQAATKLIHLEWLNQTDIHKCLDQLSPFPNPKKTLDVHDKQMIFKNNLGPLELRLLMALIRQGRSEQALKNLRDYSLVNMIHLWFNMAEQDYSRQRVQLMVQNLVAGRFGATWSDLVQWYTRKQAHVRDRPSQSLVKFAHRHSLTVGNANLWASGQLNKSNLTYSWWKRFSSIYLLPFGLLSVRRIGPHGCGLVMYLNHGLIRQALLTRYGPDVDSSLIPVHRSQAEWYTEQLSVRWRSVIPHGEYTVNTMDWRALLELPYQLAKSKQYRKLKLKCFYNMHWLREMLSIAYHEHDQVPSVQELLDEITAHLYTARSERVELFKVDMEAHPPPAALMARLDSFSFIAVQLMEDQPELMQLVGSLCCWRGQLRRDPDLIVPLCYMHFGSTRSVYDYHHSTAKNYTKKNSNGPLETERGDSPSQDDDDNDDGNNNDDNDEDVSNSNNYVDMTRDKSSHGNRNRARGSMLTQLLDQIDREASGLILRPINYTLAVQTMSKALISANQTRAKSGETSIWPKTSMEITALAYCPANKCRLAVAIWNREDAITYVEIWNMMLNQLEWSQLTKTQTLGPISLIRWLTDKAVIVVQTTRPVLTIWPIQTGQTWTDEFYELLAGSADSSGSLNNEIPGVYVTSTEDNRASYIAVVYSGKEQIDLWSSDSGKIHHLGQWNAFGQWIRPSAVTTQGESNRPRQFSLPIMTRPSGGELLVDMIHDKQYLRFVIAQRGANTAYLFTVGPITNPWRTDWSKPRALKCSPDSTRIVSVACVRVRGFIVVATRTPRDERIVGCLNLFDLNSGQLLEQIDGSADTFLCTEFNLSSQGLLAYTVPPSLRFVLSEDQMRLFTISRKPIGQPTLSTFELVAWNFNTRAYRHLTENELFPYFEPHLTPLSIPADACDFGQQDRLSVCFNVNTEMGSRISHSDIATVLNNPVKIMKREKKPPRIMGRVYQITIKEHEWIAYFCVDEEDEKIYFMSISESFGEQTCLEKFSLPENRKPNATDRFILNDNLLIVLGNLGYSEVVEECR